ncbi:MAG: hypothetical protein HYY68_07085 [Thaumarchaeota archaeon]|nr:hypothetical protein [Nitrososphaerota archaeon]
MKRPSYLALASVVTVLLSIVYYYLTIRAMGDDPAATYNITHFTTPGFIIKNWGIGLFAGSVVLNIAVAAMTGILIAVTVANYRNRKLAGTCTAGSLAIAFSTFTCPGCAVPLTATLGVAVMSTALPLFGLEFQIVTFLILLVSLVWLSRRMKFPEQVRPSAESFNTGARASSA